MGRGHDARTRGPRLRAGLLPARRVGLIAPADRDEWYSANDAYARTLAAGVLPALAEAPRPAHLHTLRLADADLHHDAGGILASIEWLPSLLALDLSRNELGGRAVPAPRGGLPEPGRGVGQRPGAQSDRHRGGADSPESSPFATLSLGAFRPHHW